MDPNGSTSNAAHPGSDDYLLKVLGELRRRVTINETDHRDPSPADFQSSTFEELSRRIIRETALKSDIARLTKENENLQANLNQHLSPPVQAQNNEQVESTKLRLDNECLSKEVERLQQERNAEVQKRQEIANVNTRLQVEIARLSADNTSKTQRVHELDDVELAHLQLSKEVIALKSQCNQQQNKCPHCTKNTRIKRQNSNQPDAPSRDNLSIYRFSKVSTSSDDEDELVNQIESQPFPSSKHRSPRTPNIATCSLDTDKESKPENDFQRGPPDSEDGGDDGLADDFKDGEAPKGNNCGPPVVIIPHMPTLPLTGSCDQTLPERDKLVVFSRCFLQKQLGGGSIALQVHIGNQRPLANQLGITSFMCPNLDHNPWAPSYPGQEIGYMFVGLGKEKDAFLVEETHELFVQFASKRMFYAGKYSCKKVEDLTPREWQGLETKIKHKYCETTIKKTKEKGPIETVLDAYNNGRLKAPCVRLKFIEYNWLLYNSLSDAAKCAYAPGNISSLEPNSVAATTLGNVGGGSRRGKRKRISSNLEGVPRTSHGYNTRKKRTRLESNTLTDLPRNQEESVDDDSDDIYM